MQLQKKNFIWNVFGAGTNAFNSLFFVIIATRINGIEKAGIFSYAFATACLLYVLGTYIVRAYQVTDLTGQYSDSDYVFMRVITCVLMLAVSIGFVIVKRYDFYKACVMVIICIYKLAEAFADVLYGIMQKKGLLYKVGISMTLKAVISLVAFLILDLLTQNLIFSCIAAAFVNVILIFICDAVTLKRIGMTKTDFSFKKIKTLFFYGFNTFILTILGVYLINVARYAIDDLLSDSLQTVFGIIIIPASVMGLLGQYIIHPLLNDISGHIEKGQYIALKRIITRIITVMLGLGTVVFACAYLLEVPVLSMIYGIDLAPYKSEMMVIIIGASMYGLQIIISYLLIAFRKTGIQVAVFAVASILSTILAYYSVKRIEIMGASCTYLFAMTIVSVALLVALVIEMLRYKKISNTANG